MHVNGLPVAGTTIPRRQIQEHNRGSAGPSVAPKGDRGNSTSVAAQVSVSLIKPNIEPPPSLRVKAAYAPQGVEAGFRAQQALHTYQEIGEARLDGAELMNRLDLFA